MDSEVDALYGLPLEEFTAARDALAKARRKDGDAEGAAAVKALRKPSPAVWALNQLTRRRKEDVDALLDAGRRLRHAQTAALDGDPSDLREATRAEAAEVDTVAGLAAALLAEAGPPASAAQRERMAATLRAAAVDPVGGEQLARGVLPTELDPAGFGFGTATGEPEPSRSPAPARPPQPRQPRQTKEDRARARAAEAAAAEDARQAHRQAVEHQKALRHAEQELDRLQREADEADARALAARNAADAARKRAEALRKEGEGAQK